VPSARTRWRAMRSACSSRRSGLNRSARMGSSAPSVNGAEGPSAVGRAGREAAARITCSGSPLARARARCSRAGRPRGCRCPSSGSVRARGAQAADRPRPGRNHPCEEKIPTPGGGRYWTLVLARVIGCTLSSPAAGPLADALWRHCSWHLAPLPPPTREPSCQTSPFCAGKFEKRSRPAGSQPAQRIVPTAAPALAHSARCVTSQ